MQVTNSRYASTLFWLVVVAAVLLAVLAFFTNTGRSRTLEFQQKYGSVLDALNSAEERTIIVFKDGEMGSVVRVPGGRTFEVKESCGSELTRRTRTSWFLERVQKVVRVNDPNYLELRTEFITRCLLAR